MTGPLSGIFVELTPMGKLFLILIPCPILTIITNPLTMAFAFRVNMANKKKDSMNLREIRRRKILLEYKEERTKRKEKLIKANLKLFEQHVESIKETKGTNIQ